MQPRHPGGCTQKGKQHKHNIEEQTQGQFQAKKTHHSGTDRATNAEHRPFTQHHSAHVRVQNATTVVNRGNYGKVCKLASTVNEAVGEIKGVFLREMASASEEPWLVTVVRHMRGSKVPFKIDTGEDVLEAFLSR